MKKIKNIWSENKVLLSVGGVALVAAGIYLVGKNKGKNDVPTEEIDLKVNLTDTDGNTSSYDPTALVNDLRKGLMTTTWQLPFYGKTNALRCEALYKLNNLSNPKFMAVVKGYNTRYNSGLTTDLEACYFDCSSSPMSGIINRIKILKQTFK